ncbi:uncharacterized protein TNCT_85221 [Trichonephila clavata]|uniref:Uncharacterized protein n=1 Tax=Trichonephila clavata TaxID=2740835 RepID=A0A8X6K724_TRICU|nr:uncharacterized protein TNCT_85221 [Trichonephila clavata]
MLKLNSNIIKSLCDGAGARASRYHLIKLSGLSAGLKFDILTCQAYKLAKARYTLTNEAVSEFHRKTVGQSVSERLMNLYYNDMEKKLRKQDSKELKQNPPRVAS